MMTPEQQDLMNSFGIQSKEFVRTLLTMAKLYRDAIVKLPHNGVTVSDNDQIELAGQSYYHAALKLSWCWTDRYERLSLFEEYGFTTNNEFHRRPKCPA